MSMKSLQQLCAKCIVDHELSTRTLSNVCKRLLVPYEEIRGMKKLLLESGHLHTRDLKFQLITPQNRRVEVTQSTRIYLYSSTPIKQFPKVRTHYQRIWHNKHIVSFTFPRTKTEMTFSKERIGSCIAIVNN